MQTYSSFDIRLLVIEDNLDERNIFEEFFKRDKNIHLCGVAKDGVEGIEKVKVCNPSIVLTDFLMPKLDGAEVVKNIKDISDGQIKVIVLSAISNAKIADEALSNGADYYAMKPIELSELSNKIVYIYQKGLGINYSYMSQTHNKNNKNKVYINIFINNLGVPINCSGYNYIIEAINIIFSVNKVMTMKEIYCMIAKNNMTSIECVEACIHNAIKKTHKVCNKNYESLFGNFYNKCPGNSAFLNTVKEKLYVMSI